MELQNGGQLIFLISQPRSGSSMLQCLLASHSGIHTLPEPWIMLHLLYARRTEGIQAEYNARFAGLALGGFLDQIKDGDEVLKTACRNFANTLYSAALAGTEKSRFLDKTPRYYFIIEELADLFPAAKFIFLVRNPVAVFASMLDYNFNGDWLRMVSMVDRRHDLFTAPRRILEGVNKIGARGAVIKYEDLVRDSANEIQRICELLDVEFEPNMLRYERSSVFAETTFLDSKGINKHNAAVTDYINAWKQSLNTPVKLLLAQFYIEELGGSVMKAFGEDLETQLSDLNRHLEGRSQRFGQIGLSALKKSLTGKRENLTRRERLWLQWRIEHGDSSFREKLRGSLLTIVKNGATR